MGIEEILGGWQCTLTLCTAQDAEFNIPISILKWQLLVGVVSSTAKLRLTSLILCPSKMLWQPDPRQKQALDRNSTGRYLLCVSYFILLNATTFYRAIIKGMNCLHYYPVTAVKAFPIKIDFSSIFWKLRARFSVCYRTLPYTHEGVTILGSYWGYNLQNTGTDYKFSTGFLKQPFY